ncbi:uncharacterized protein LOC124165475 [Ischnura elegans]|uniref:uncharacterized protein LOC124165475 n=1 Tax=Ischnura elegans TaxID=197161 RepID=UPI001ED895C6|nr:uncharacterized protein LOC124165475 [Ischnura elegans]
MAEVINPLNVLRLMRSKFLDTLSLSETTVEEIDLAEKLTAILKSCAEDGKYDWEVEDDLVFDDDNERNEETVEGFEESSSDSERDEDISPTSPSSSTSYDVSPMKKPRSEPSMLQKKKGS